MPFEGGTARFALTAGLSDARDWESDTLHEQLIVIGAQTEMLDIGDALHVACCGAQALTYFGLLGGPPPRQPPAAPSLA